MHWRRRDAELGMALQRRAQRSQALFARAAARAAAQVLFQREHARDFELLVDVAVQEAHGLRAFHVPVSSLAPRSLSDCCSSRRPRAMRDMTVPIGTSHADAISR